MLDDETLLNQVRLELVELVGEQATYSPHEVLGLFEQAVSKVLTREASR